jgi:hypothetical protein
MVKLVRRRFGLDTLGPAANEYAIDIEMLAKKYLSGTISVPLYEERGWEIRDMIERKVLRDDR